MQFAQFEPGKGPLSVHPRSTPARRDAAPRTLQALIGSALRTAIALRYGNGIRGAMSLSRWEIAQTLATRGRVALGSLLNAQQCSDIERFLAPKTLIAPDSDGPGFTLATAPATARLADYALSDVLQCPHILELANSPRLLALAADYIGCKPTISALALRWSFPPCDGADAPLACRHHAADRRAFTVLVCLNDGTDAAFHSSHDHTAPLSRPARSDLAAARGPERRHMVARKLARGRGYALDTDRAREHGEPRGTAQLVLQIRYSLLPCVRHAYQPLRLVRAVQFDRYVNRLLIKPAPVLR